MSEPIEPPTPSEPSGPPHRSGFVALAGRPNAGKSTLLNRVLGRKLAIVTPKPQTTRRRMLGIKTLPHAQIVFVDTPGIHSARDLLNERMVQQAVRSVHDADVVVWLIDASAPLDAADREIAALLVPLGARVVVALNKIDTRPRGELLPLIREIAELLPGAQPVPISALRGENLETLLEAICEKLPESPPYYPAEDLTDETERSIAAEIVREKVMLETRDEIPYSVAVTVDEFTEKPEKNLVVIKATVHVERESQKPIVIGQQGKRIKAIGQAARREIEDLLERRVFLELFVRVQPNWTRHKARLEEFGL